MSMLKLKEREEIRILPKDAPGDAFFDLGVAYSTGQGVPLDLIEAHKWFNLAALRGSEPARQWRSDLAREMSTDQIAEAQRQAREWLRTN